jgi:protein TonB
MTFVPAPQGAPGPLEQRANAITPENPIPRRVTSESMLYPAEAAAVQAGGNLTLQITLDEFGRVAESRATHFGIASPVMELTSASLSAGNYDLRNRLKGTIVSASGKTAQMLELYDALVRAATDAVKQWRYDPPFKGPISFPVTLRFGQEPAPAEMAFVSADKGAPARALSNGPVLRAGFGGTKAPAKIKDVKPVYPEIAKASGVQGIVVIEVRIEPDGTVGTASVIRSIPLLDEAALDAVKQWRFTPTLLNGEPTAVMMTVTINFTLGQSEKTPPPEPPASGSAAAADLAPAWAPDRAKVGFEPYWSPDRTRLAFFSNRDGKPELYVMNRDGSGLRKLTYRPDQK